MCFFWALVSLGRSIRADEKKLGDFFPAEKNWPGAFKERLRD